MCGIFGYIGKRNCVPVECIYEFERFSSIVDNFGHTRWTSESFNKSNYFSCLEYPSKDVIDMNLLNFIKKEKYYAQISESFQNILAQSIIDKKEICKKLEINYRTLYRIRKKHNYWCNLKTLFSMCKLLNISEKELISSILLIKTKNSFPMSLINLRINPSLSRILGHIIGDGGIHVVENENKYRAFYTNNEKILINSFRNDTLNVFGRIKLYSRERIGHADEIWLPSTIGHVLHTLLEYGKEGKKKIPRIIKESLNNNIITSFLQALYDDEGFLYPKKKMIVISLVEYTLVSDIRDLVLKLGINANKMLIHNSKSRSRMHYFSITGKDNIVLFKEKIGFQHPIKKVKLDLMVNIYR